MINDKYMTESRAHVEQFKCSCNDMAGHNSFKEIVTSVEIFFGPADNICTIEEVAQLI